MRKKLNGFYRGKVVKHLDHGKCKVFVKGIHDNKWETDYKMLPDAEQIAPLFGGSVLGNGVFSYPNIGSMVLVGFWNGDQRYPFFYGAIMGGPESAGQYGICNVFKDNDDGAYIHKMVAGRSSITMSQVGCITIENSAPDPNTQKIKNTTILMDQSGNIEINTTKSVRITTDETEIQSKKSIQMYTSEMKILADQRIQINSPYISFNTRENTNTKGETTSISKDGEDGFQIVSDTIKLNAEEGYIVTSSLTNNQKLI